MTPGSSPLTRGKPITIASVICLTRLIPAHAGKTDLRRALTSCRGAHPRSRGENKAHAMRTGLRGGSSPLTRGKRLSAWSQCYLLGLIPAHAGKTTVGIRPGSRSTAHPRSRGENKARVWRSLMGGGSSPLTRGKPVEVDQEERGSGLIPAHAGKTRPAGSRRS